MKNHPPSLQTAGAGRPSAPAPENGAVRLCILAAYRSNDPASAGLLIAAAYAAPPPIRPALVLDDGA
jgi:hypothetical protein